MEETLELIIIKNSEHEKPFELRGFIGYDSISSLSFCAEVISICLRSDHKFSKEQIIHFPYKYQNLTNDEIAFFKTRLEYYTNSYNKRNNSN